MLEFDLAVINFLLKLFQAVPMSERFFNWCAHSAFVKGEMTVPFLWWAWFTRSEDGRFVHRTSLLISFVATSCATITARLLAIGLPFRNRPVHTPELEQLFAHYGVGAKDWSSFPSDHAVLYAGLATTAFYVNRRFGILASLYVGLFICLPRMVVGLHFTTDILAGILLGVSFVVLANYLFQDSRIIPQVLDWSERKPHLFYPIFFWCTLQIVSLFRTVRAIAQLVT